MSHAIARRPVAQRLREWLVARCLAPINLDGSQVSEVTIDGQSVSQVTMDGEQVFGAAIPDSVLDNFESANSGPVGPYESGDTIATYYSRDTGQYSRTTSNVLEDSNALQVGGGSSAGWIWSAPGDGLPRYFSAGDTARFLIRGTTDMQFPALFYGSPDGSSGYSSVLDTSTGGLEIRRFDSGSVTTIQNTSVSVSGSTWYWGETRIPASDDSTNGISPNLVFDVYNVDTSSGVARGSSIGSVSVEDYNHSGRYHGAVNHEGTPSGTSVAILDGIEVV